MTTSMRYRWIIEPPDEAVISRLQQKLEVSNLLARCMFNRGLSTPEDASVFLHPRLRDLKDPMLLPNMEIMTNRLWEARRKKGTDRHFWRLRCRWGDLHRSPAGGF
ncbi:MAG: hypothetical protein LR011_11105 [Verrucomicrobia bacterium]|nr:hypothetical protein [Verrucomicrobiota bacterium]